MLDILLHRQRMPETLVLDNSGVADTLVLAEDTVGKRVTFPSDLQSAIREVVKIKYLPPRPSERSSRSRMICLRSYDMVNWSLTWRGSRRELNAAVRLEMQKGGRCPETINSYRP